MQVLKLMRARSLGLPAPGFRDFIPFMSSKNNAGAYSPTRPGNGLFSFLKPSRGGYSGAGTRAARTRGAFDDSEGGGAWDARIEGDEEFAYHGAAPPVQNKPTGVLSRGREQDLGAGMEMERGRSRSRAGDEVYPADGGEELAAAYADTSAPKKEVRTSYRGAEVYVPKADNPFEEDVKAQRKKDGFGNVGTLGGRASMDSTRRSAFREGI